MVCSPPAPPHPLVLHWPQDTSELGIPLHFLHLWLWWVLYAEDLLLLGDWRSHWYLYYGYLFLLVKDGSRTSLGSLSLLYEALLLPVCRLCLLFVALSSERFHAHSVVLLHQFPIGHVHLHPRVLYRVDRFGVHASVSDQRHYQYFVVLRSILRLLWYSIPNWYVHFYKTCSVVYQSIRIRSRSHPNPVHLCCRIPDFIPLYILFKQDKECRAWKRRVVLCFLGAQRPLSFLLMSSVCIYDLFCCYKSSFNNTTYLLFFIEIHNRIAGSNWVTADLFYPTQTSIYSLEMH